MLIRRKLRNNLPVLTKNSMISVSLSRRNRQRAKQKLYFDRRGTREMKLLKSGYPVRIRDPIKKRWSKTGTVRAEVALRSYTVLTSSHRILRRNRRDLLKIRNRIVPKKHHGSNPLLERNEEQIPASDSESEVRLAPTNGKQNTEVARPSWTTANMCFKNTPTTENELIKTKRSVCLDYIDIKYISTKLHPTPQKKNFRV